MMRAFALGVLIAMAGTPAFAQHSGHEAPVTAAPAPAPADPDCPPEHAAMGHCTPRTGTAPEPPRHDPSSPKIEGEPENAADKVWGAQAMEPSRREVYRMHGAFRGGKVMIDRLEYRAQNGRDGYAWEGDAWYGGDYDRLWLKTNGEGVFGKSPETAEMQALWSHALDPWFNMQAGLRQDIQSGPDRTHLAVGVQGLAPYFFDVDVGAFLSDHGDLTARIEAEYDQRITSLLILQPRMEMNLAAQDVPATGVGAGLSSIETGVRLRYEFVPEFAPYLGVEYSRDIGRTAAFTRNKGDDVGGWSFVLGLRTWF